MFGKTNMLHASYQTVREQAAIDAQCALWSAQNEMRNRLISAQVGAFIGALISVSALALHLPIF